MYPGEFFYKFDDNTLGAGNETADEGGGPNLTVDPDLPGAGLIGGAAGYAETPSAIAAFADLIEGDFTVCYAFKVSATQIDASPATSITNFAPFNDRGGSLNIDVRGTNGGLRPRINNNLGGIVASSVGWNMITAIRSDGVFKAWIKGTLAQTYTSGQSANVGQLAGDTTAGGVSLLAFDDSLGVDLLYFADIARSETFPAAMWNGGAGVSTLPVEEPGKVTNLTVTDVGDGEVTIVWSPPGFTGGSSVTGYKVYRGTVSGSLTLLDTPTASTYTDSTAVNGTPYFYNVRATNAIGDGRFSSTEVTGTPIGPPEAIDDLAVTEEGDGTVDLAWTAPANGGSAITSYKIYKDGVEEDEVDDAILTYEVTGLVNGTPYDFTVTPLNAEGEGDPSNEVTGTPESPASEPDAVDDLAATAIGNGTVTLAWTAPADGGSAITSYKIYKDGVEEDEVDDLILTCQVTGLTNGTPYDFTVTAINAEGESDPSNEVTATPATVPSAPTAISATQGLGTVTIAYSDNANGGAAITNHKIFRGTVSGALSQIDTDVASPYVDSTGTPGTLYFYALKAVNSQGDSALSNEVSAAASAGGTGNQSQTNLWWRL